MILYITDHLSRECYEGKYLPNEQIGLLSPPPNAYQWFMWPEVELFNLFMYLYMCKSYGGVATKYVHTDVPKIR